MAFRWILERVEFTHKIEISSGDRVYTIGRSKENVIKCLSLHVSRKHCKILQRGENLTIVDLSSSNGTYINKTRILSEREIPLQEGDLIGVGVSETTDSDCYVFRLCRKVFKKLLPQFCALPDSSTGGHEVVIITDSDSESGAQDSREAEAKDSRKQPVLEERNIIPKVSRLGDATMNLGTSSNLSVINSGVFSGSVKRERKRQYEEPNDVTKSKKCTYEQKSRRLDKRSVTRTAYESEVFDIVSDCGETEEKNVNTLSSSATALDIAHDSGLAGDCVASAASNSASVPVSRIVENELKTKVEPVALLSEVSNRSTTSSPSCASVHLNSATFNKRKSNNEEVSSVTDHKTTTQNAEPEVLHHCRTNSITMDMTVVSVPFGGIECESDKMEIGLHNSVRSTACEGFRTKLLNSKFPCVIKKEVVSPDNSLQRTSAGSTCTVNEVKHERCVEPTLHKERPVDDNKDASERSSEGPSCTVNKSLSLGIRDVNKWLGTDKARHAGSAGACTSNMLQSCLTNEGARITESTTCITVHDKAVSQLNVEVGKDAASCSLYGKNNHNGSHSNIVTSNRTELRTVQSKGLGMKIKSNEDNNIVPASCSVDVSKVFNCEQVPKSESDVPLGNQDVTAELCSSATFKVENTESLNKPVKKKLKQTLQSVGGTYKSSLSLVSKEPRTVLCKRNKSFVVTRGDGVGTHEKSRLLNGAPELAVNSITGSYVDGDGFQLPVQHPGISYGDKNKSKSNIPPVKCHDKHMGSSGILEHPALETGNLPIETLISDDKEQLVPKKGKKKPKRLRIVSVFSSSSDEDAEIEGCQKQLESPEQTMGIGKSNVHLLKGKQALPLTSENSTNSDCLQFEKASTESVDKVSTKSSKSHTSVQNSVGSVDEYKGKNIAQVNKNAGSSGSVEGKTLSDEQFVQMCKNKVVVKLERLDNIWKSDNLVVSEHANESLNYTLDEDIIVVSGDSDEDFPSSQIFDDQKPSAELLKTEGKDAAHEEPVFHEDLDELVLEDDDSDFDDNWFKKLSQQDFEPEEVSELPPQHLPVETVRKDTGSREGSLKDVSVPQVAAEGEGTEKVPLAGDLLKTGHEVKQQLKEPVNKHVYSAKTLIIDAPPLPPRRAFQRGISAESATQMYKEQMDICQQVVKPRNIVSNAASKKKTDSRKKKVKLHLSIPDDPRNLTAKQKKQIADNRKEKLKAISEKEKMVAAASKKDSLKMPAEVRVKVTNKNRGAFLIEGAESTAGGGKVANIAEMLVSSSAVKKSHLDVEKLLKQGGSKDCAPQPKRRESRSSSAPVRSVKALPRIPRISERHSSCSVTELEVHYNTKVETTSLDRFPIPTSAFPTLPISKTFAPTRNAKEKKTVRFKNDSELVQIRVIPVAEDSRLLPVARKKDAPTPRKVVHKQLQQKGPDLEEVLHHILCWNPQWLTEQKNQAVAHPPPVFGNTLWPMLSSFVTYNDYLRVLTPLLLLELWTSVSKEYESDIFVRRKARLVVGIDQVDAVPRLTLNKRQLMHITCHAVLSEHASQGHLHPHTGDLVYLELELENADDHNVQPETSTKQRRVVPIFAYVKCTIKDTVTERTSVHKEILKHSSRPSTKLTLVLLAKYRPYDVKISHAMRIMVVSYIKPDLRLFQAMAHLLSSPLCSHILMPTTQDFSLSDITNQEFVPLIKQDKLSEAQKRAILQAADACLRAEPKICMIQGPPGTGKSLVVVNLIIQILYAQKQYRKHGSRRNVPRILVCAPSNAAIDELVIRLLRIRQSIQKEDRFRMVRNGRLETMKPSVKDISVIELAKRDARSNAQVLECVESVDLEIRNLEARKNSLSMALETAKQKNKNDVIGETEFKLGEVEMKLLQLRKSKMQNTSVLPQDLLRLERDAQSRIILGADIVATTLSSCFNNQMETVFNMHKDTAGFQFTCCIVDEATQSQELETLIPLMLGVNTLVLVGDAQQLPATVLSKVAKDHGLGKSLFARLQSCFEDTARNPVVFLDTQYRMHPDICLWPSRYFYNGRLHSAPNMAQQRGCPLVPYCILSLDYEQNISGELSNVGEAELVSQLTLGLLEKLGNQKYSIAIITPYNMQRTVISSLLHASSYASQSVEVNTIDSFQGQERDIIVMSCVRTGGIGFLSDMERLNVALTRARCSLLLCGNFTSLQNDNMWRALLENANQRNVLKHVPSSVAKNKDELLKLVLRDG